MSAAFELLRRHARNTNRKLHAVAAEVVAGTLQISSPRARGTAQT